MSRFKQSAKGGNALPEMIGRSAGMWRVFEDIERLSQTDCTTLIYGETGTGKELVATDLHMRSDRDRKPFVCVNCAGLPDSLIESELFGHVRGAFTTAVSDRIGRFEAASGGTLFLDEGRIKRYILTATRQPRPALLGTGRGRRMPTGHRRGSIRRRSRPICACPRGRS